jgi:hypothetical protein
MATDTGTTLEDAISSVTKNNNYDMDERELLAHVIHRAIDELSCRERLSQPHVRSTIQRHGTT